MYVWAVTRVCAKMFPLILHHLLSKSSHIKVNRSAEKKYSKAATPDLLEPSKDKEVFAQVKVILLMQLWRPQKTWGK